MYVYVYVHVCVSVYVYDYAYIWRQEEIVIDCYCIIGVLAIISACKRATNALNYRDIF